MLTKRSDILFAGQATNVYFRLINILKMFFAVRFKNVAGALSNANECVLSSLRYSYKRKKK